MRWRGTNWTGDRRGGLGLALRWALAVGLVALALVLGQPTALGLTFTVNTTDDTVDANPGDGDCQDASRQCSLRAAVMEANAQGPGPHTIVLQPGARYVLTRNVDGSGHEVDSGADNDDLDIYVDITIQGNGARVTVLEQEEYCNVDGTAKDREFRIFHVHEGGALTLDGLNTDKSCADGNNQWDGYGGVILFDSTNTLRIRNRSQIVGGEALDAGGVIAILGGTMEVEDSSIDHGVAGDPMLRRMNSGLGGVIYMESASGSIKRSSVHSGTASSRGGGIYQDTNSSLDIEDSEIWFNRSNMVQPKYGTRRWHLQRG